MNSFDFDSYMQKAFNLGLKGVGHVLPNPLVGSVLVHNNKIISKGYHKAFGQAHAEKMCLSDMEPPEGSVLFISLEPCCHYGKTSPCTDIIIEKKIRKVVISNMDPNPLVNGKGIEILGRNNVEVICGINRERGLFLNRHYFYYIKNNLPYITLKLGSTLDGKIADRNYKSQWITNSRSRMKAHWLRGINQAIMVGINTFILDNPKLNSRFSFRQMPSPIRVLIDRKFRLNNYLERLDDGIETLIYSHRENKHSFPCNIKYIHVKDGSDIITEAVNDLGKREIASLLLEGGGEIAFEFLKRGLIKEFHITYSPKILGGKESIHSFSGDGFLLDEAVRIKKYRIYRFDEDFEFEGYL